MSISFTLNQIVTFWSLLRHPRKTRDQIIAFQNTQLRRLIKHAYSHVPYYRRLLNSNRIRPDDIRSIDDLQIIPLTSREEMQALPVEDLIAQGIDPDDLLVQRTSGSSGMPLTIRRTLGEVRFLFTFYLRALHGYGLKMKDRGVNVRLYRPPKKTLSYQMRRALGFYRWDHADCLQAPMEILRTLQEARPDALAGYPGTLFHCADFLLNSGGFAIQPRFIVTGGEALAPLMRERIVEAFQAPVYDTYNSHEFRLLAWECKETGEYHTCDDGMILEVLKNGRPVRTGERGEVVGTNLHAFSMPFIRYRLGDIVTKGADICPCGQPFSTIREVQGRMIDYFPLPGGRVLHPYAIVTKIIPEMKSWLQRYQLLQEREDRIILQVVTKGKPPPQKIGELEESVRTLLGKDVTFQITEVPDIPLERNGKFRVSRSLVSSAYDEIDWDLLKVRKSPPSKE